MEDKVILKCSTVIEDSGEKIQIKFYDSDTTIRTVKVKIKDLSDEEISNLTESLRQNYCNNKVEGEYSCDVERTEKYLVLKEEGVSNVLMGEVKRLDIDKYKKNLKEKGFECE